jgi:hypothetical protein
LLKNQTSIVNELYNLDCAVQHISVIAVTETWTTVDNENLVNIDGFAKLLNSDTAKKGGCVGLFLNNKCNIKYSQA